MELDFRESLSRSWKIYKENMRLLYGVFALWAITYLTSYMFSMMLPKKISFIASFISLFIYAFSHAGATFIFYDLVNGKKDVGIGRFFDGISIFYKLPFLWMLEILIYLLGFICLIIPGVVLTVGLKPVSFVCVIEDPGIFPSFKRTWKITSGYKWDVLCFFLLMFSLNLAGALCFVVGLLVSIPLSFLIMTDLYNSLLKNATQEKESVSVECQT